MANLVSTPLHIEATITIQIVENENDGCTIVTVNSGRLQREECLFVAIQALTNEIREMVIPAAAGIPSPCFD